MKLLKQVFAYLAATSHYAITYRGGAVDNLQKIIKANSDFKTELIEPTTLTFFKDASFGGEKPMAGHVGFLSGGPTTWQAYRLPLTPLSSCEAEYVAATKAAISVASLRGILEFLDMIQTTPTVIFSDNQAAILLSDSNTSSKRMKHIATRIAFLREQISDGKVLLYHIKTAGQVADIFTKALNAATFHLLRTVMLR